jgi:hypothetical protein
VLQAPLVVVALGESHGLIMALGKYPGEGNCAAPGDVCEHTMNGKMLKVSQGTTNI